MNTIDGTSVVYKMADGVHAHNMANVRALYAATDVTQNLQGKIMLSTLVKYNVFLRPGEAMLKKT